MELLLPKALVGEKSGPTDPILYYYSGWGLGKIFRRRVEMGLEMITDLRVGARVLEVGYGAGLVLYNLARPGRELYGLDLDADPVSISEKLKRLGVSAQLSRGSVLDMQNLYPDGFFDLVVCFSTLEHIAEARQALAEMKRVTNSGGCLLIGMPAVNRFMELAFQAIGFKNIHDHHCMTPAEVWNLILQKKWRAKRRQLPAGVPFAAALYHTFFLRNEERG